MTTRHLVETAFEQAGQRKIWPGAIWRANLDAPGAAMTGIAAMP